MSEVNFIVIKGENLYFAKAHYRKIIEAVKNPEKFKKLLKSRHYLDAGYLILDFNNQTIINCQTASALPKHKFGIVSI
ncbi:hypothetical protein KY346_01770 [Candidatus Woesearchaeota archaeon]|nr:hypothetical protein [Candidatus Woesearchaeota archaeon]